jgi:hypothetical protein
MQLILFIYNVKLMIIWDKDILPETALFYQPWRNADLHETVNLVTN